MISKCFLDKLRCCLPILFSSQVYSGTSRSCMICADVITLFLTHNILFLLLIKKINKGYLNFSWL
jgi:hypothetical protein